MAKYLSRNERKAEIVSVLLGRVGTTPKRMSVTQLARAMGMRASTHLRQICYELYEDGAVRVEIVQHRSNMDKAVFYLDVEKGEQLVLL